MLAALLVLAAADVAHAQLFVGSRPKTELQVGPLFVRASVTPALGPVAVDVLWSFVVPAHRSAADFEQTIYFVWPGEVVPDPAVGKADPALNRYVEERGFTVIEDGRVALSAQSAYSMESDAPPERIAGGATFVTYVRQGGVMGLTTPATYVRIPWHPKMANRAWLMHLHFRAPGLLRPKPLTWLESTFWGRRYRFELGFNDVRSRSIFPLYFENRDRVLRLAEEPSQLIMLFADAERLKVDEISPGSATRRRHESLENTEQISRFLDTSEGIVPQTLTVQFGYFSGLQSWAPILIPVLFFVLGNIVRPLLEGPVKRAGRTVLSRVHIGPATGSRPPRDTGVVLSREQLARLVPGETTREQVLALCGPPPEEFEQMNAPERRTLIYRGRRVVPRRRRRFGWVSTVVHWDVEQHEVEIVLVDDRVHDVQARVRRTHLTDPTAAS